LGLRADSEWLAVPNSHGRGVIRLVIERVATGFTEGEDFLKLATGSKLSGS